MNGMDGSGGASRFVVMLAVAVMGFAGVCDRAVGQVRAIEKRYVTVEGDGAALRCGADVIWYSVAGVRAGEVLEVDGEKDAWFRASYPVDGRVVVKLNEGQHIQEEGVVVLTRRSRLKAYNPQDPVMEECWKGVFADNQLPLNTKLIYVGDMMDRSGAHAGYVAVAPAGARGYILKGAVRDATAQEIAVYRGEQGRISDIAEARQLDQPIRRRAETAVIGRDGAIEQERTAPAETVAQREPEPEVVDEPVAIDAAPGAETEIADAPTAAVDGGGAAIEAEVAHEPETTTDEPEAPSEWSLGEAADRWAQGGADEVVEYEPFANATQTARVDEPARMAERHSAVEDAQDPGAEEFVETPADEVVVDERFIETVEDYREPEYLEPERTEMVANQDLRQIGEEFTQPRPTAEEFGGQYVAEPNDAESSASEEGESEPAGAWINPTGRVLTLSELDAAYDRVVSREGENPEYDTLIREYRRHSGNLPDEVGTDRVRAYVGTRVQLLEIAAELAEGEAELASLAMDAEYAVTQTTRLALRMRESSGFDLVGRLVASAVYDGERLPMLYRLVSVEGRVGRTVAYLTDEAALGMDGKLGSVVGVRGVGEPGEVGLVRVIRPEEVTVLTGVASAGWSE